MISAENLKILRTQRGLSQRALGRLTGIDQPSIYKLEHGIQPDVRASTLIKLADALDCSIDYLVGRTKKYNAA